MVDAGGGGQLSPAGVLDGKHLRRRGEWVFNEGLPAIAANVSSNLASGLKPWQPVKVRDAEVAVVGYGPSLTASLPALAALAQRGVPVWTCSKAHDAVLAAGIPVARHTDVEYRPHKALYIREFRPEIEYVLGLQIHPSYLARLRDAGIEPKAFLMSIPGMPPGTAAYRKTVIELPERLRWVPDAGLTIASLAYGIGYRRQHWFGIDAGLGEDGATHAGMHEGVKSNKRDVLVDGQIRGTSEILIREAIVADEMLRAAPKLRVTIHGDGLLRPFLLARGIQLS